jgi:iron complex transport system substrate-binding protein
MKKAMPLRIVSLLPSATEIACALALGEELVGITHCCDYPMPVIRGKPLVVHSAIRVHKMSLREIDTAVSQHLRAGKSLYHVDEALLRRLAPTLMLTQDLCQVCAPAGNEVGRALDALMEKPEVIWMSPHSIGDIEGDILAVGKATARVVKAKQLITRMRERLDRVAERVAALDTRPRVFCAEWLDPVYCSGHWVPEMVEIAGGVDVLGRKWADSVRVEWDRVIEAQPEVIILMACGYNCAESMKTIQWLFEQHGFEGLPAARLGRVFVVDAGYFSRPGPRIVDGVELLAHLLHPEKCAWSGLRDAFALPRMPART